MMLQQNTNDALIGTMLKAPLNQGDEDLLRIAAELEDIARWLKRRRLMLSGGNPEMDLMSGFGSAPSSDMGVNILRSIASGA
jgi:hypothetical protein